MVAVGDVVGLGHSVSSWSTGVAGSDSKASPTSVRASRRGRRRTRTARPAPAARSSRRRCGDASARRTGRGSRSRCRRCRPGRRRRAGAITNAVMTWPKPWCQTSRQSVPAVGSSSAPSSSVVSGVGPPPFSTAPAATAAQQPVALCFEVGDVAAGPCRRDRRRAAPGRSGDPRSPRRSARGSRRTAPRDRSRAPAARRRSAPASAGACRRTARPGGPAAGRRRRARAGRAPDRRCASGGGGRWPAGPRGTSRAPTRGPTAPASWAAARFASGWGIGGIASRAASGSWTMNISSAWRTRRDVLGRGPPLRLGERRADVLLGARCPSARRRARSSGRARTG